MAYYFGEHVYILFDMAYHFTEYFLLQSQAALYLVTIFVFQSTRYAILAYLVDFSVTFIQQTLIHVSQSKNANGSTV
jgi:hypothetical protein